MSKDVIDGIALAMNGTFMLAAVYFPKFFGDGIWSKAVFTTNFIAFMLVFGGLVSRGAL